MLQLLTKTVTTIDRNNTAISGYLKIIIGYDRAVLKNEFFKVHFFRDTKRLLGVHSLKNIITHKKCLQVRQLKVCEKDGS